jgi:FdhD protein
MRAAQQTFADTGGLHAAAVFDGQGRLLVLREDIGRHNAVDKVVGHGLLSDRFPFDAHVLLVSGRASFEIVQKALASRIPIVCAISAPSSLAVELARDSEQTLVGFLRGATLNIYSRPDRVVDT